MNPAETAAGGGSDAAERQRTRGYVKSTVKHGSVYLIGTALSRMAGLIMLPIYTRVLSPSEYGILEILGHTTDIVTMLAGLGIGTAVMRYYYLVETEAERKEVISSAALMLLTVFAFVAVTALALAEPGARALFGSRESTDLDPREAVALVRLAVVTLVLGITIDVPMIVLRARQQSTAVVGAGLARLGIALACNLVLVVWLRLGVRGVMYSTIVSSAIVGGTLMVTLLREAGVRFVPGLARKLIAFGAPLVVWEIGSFILHFSDRYFLRVFASLSVVGLYSLSYKLAMLVPMFVTGPFGAIWLPKALEIERAEGPRAVPILATIQRHYNLALVTISLGIALYAGDAIRLATGAAFHEADRPVALLTLGMVFFGYRQVAQVGAIIRERPGLVARSTAIAAVAVLLLNLLLIPVWGIMGAAAATCAAFLIDFLVIRWYSMRLYPLRIEFGAAPLALAAVAWTAARLAVPDGAGIALSLGVNTAAFALYALALVATGVVTPSQRRFVGHAVMDPIGTLRSLRGA